MVKRVLVRFLNMAVPVMLIAGIGLAALIMHFDALRVEQVGLREDGMLRAMESIVVRELASVSVDAHMGDTMARAGVLADGAFEQGPLAAALSTWVDGRGRYAGLRVIDTAGQVRLAIERSSDNTVVTSAAARSQSAADAHLTGTRALAAHEQVFSSMAPGGRDDARSAAPLIHVVSAVSDALGAVNGYFLLSYDTRHLRASLADFFQVSSAIETVLLDLDGGALLDSDHGFGVWGPGDETAAAALSPPSRLIAAARQAGRSPLKVDGGLLVFHDFHPVARLKEQAAGSGQDRVMSAGADRWLAIRFVPDAVIHADGFTHTTPGRVAVVAVFAVLLGILFIAAIQAERTATARQAQMDLMAARAREVGEVIDGAPSGILVVDRQGRVVRANRELEEMLGYGPFELVGQPVETLIPERFRAAHPGHRAAYARDPVPRRMAEQSPEQSLVARRKDGTEIPVVINLSRISVAGEDWIIATVADMRARREFEAQLTAARDEAQRANQVKSAFLASMSHEIRTPINAIVGLGHLLGHSPLDAEQRRDVDAMQVSAKSLLTLVNDVLDFSRIEADELVIEHRAFRPAELLADLRTMFAASAAQAGVTLSIHDLPATLPTWLSGDPARLHQIAANFLSNAIKFTGGGRVDLRFEPVGVPEGQTQRVRLSVTDTGIGIDAEAQRRLFDPFVQADASTSRRFGGSGLGLSIVRRLVELMGGEAGCESRLGVGSTFHVELPFEVAEPPLAGDNPRDAIGPVVSVAVLSRDRDASCAASRVCRDFGWQVLEVVGGDALSDEAQVKELARLPLDALLVDASADPAWVARCLQALGHGPDQGGPVVVALLEAADAASATGEVLEKPLDPAAVALLVDALCVRRRDPLDRTELADRLPDGAQHLAGVRVLAVDDSELNLQVVERLLRREGALVSTCLSGELALGAFRTAEVPFDAILMDIQMPGMDGFETVAQLRAIDTIPTPPVIAFTAGATREHFELAAAVGIDDVLTKPVEPRVLVRVIRQCIEAAVGRTVPVVLQAASADPGPTGWPVIAGIDSATAATMMGGDADFFASMLEAFVDEHAALHERIRDALAAGDAAQGARVVHKLRGQAGNIGATGLHAAAGDIEQILLEGDLAPERINALREQHQSLCAAISDWLATRNYNDNGDFCI